MNDRSRRVLHLVGGMYLIYLGIQLISEQLKAPTSNAIIAWAGAVLFLIFGAIFAFRSIKKFVVDYKEQETENGQEKRKNHREHNKRLTEAVGDKSGKRLVEIIHVKAGKQQQQKGGGEQ